MEKVVEFGPYKNLVGILSKGFNNNKKKNIPAVIILNAGTIHRVGPNRIYVKLARELSERGYDVLRFDFSGIGDSEQRKDSISYFNSTKEEVVSAMNYLNNESQIKNFLLIGHCSGVAISLLTALNDPRVVGAVLINPPTPDTDEGQRLQSYQYYWRKALFRPTSWKRLFFGKSDYRRILKSAIDKILGFKRKREKTDPDATEFIKSLSDALYGILKRKRNLLFITSGREIGIEYYLRNLKKEMSALIDNELLQIKTIPEGDHTFTALSSQEKLFLMIHCWIEKSGFI